jgi:hypothetical protein
MEFGFLERAVDGVIWRALLLHDMQGEALTSQIKNLSTRIHLAKQLLTLVHTDSLQPKIIADVMTQVSKLNSFRNNLVHGPWGTYDMTLDFWEKTSVSDKNFKPKMFRVKRQEILDNITLAQETRAALLELRDSVVGSFLEEIGHVPWPEKLRRRTRPRRQTPRQNQKQPPHPPKS